MTQKKTVCYEDFGAVGDGVTDDFDAIKAAHEYANEKGLDVVTDENKTYYIGDTGEKSSIIIKTNVDWTKSNFIIDDSEITVDMPARNTVIFKIWYDHDPVVYTEENDTPNGAIAKINAAGGIPLDASRLDLGLGYPAMLTVSDETKRVYIRYGPNKNAGIDQREIICVDAEGMIDPTTPPLLPYDRVTKITVYRTDDKPITVRGGIFTTVANRAMEDYKYYQRGIYVSRSNVTVTDFTYRIIGEGDHGDPYLATLSVRGACNVLIKDSVFAGHKYYLCVGSGGGEPVGMGTYSIDALYTNNLIFRNCVQSNFFEDDGVTVKKGIWGIMGSSYCKNLAYEGSRLSRFDAHQGVYNARIVDSELVNFRMIGGGEMRIENSHIHNSILLGMREDFGSWWRGDITIKDVTLHNTGEPTLIYAGWVNHDFGYTTHLPRSITVDNLKITKGDKVNIFTPGFVASSDKILSDEVDGKPNVNKMTPPQRIIIKNNHSGYKFIMPDTEFFKNTVYEED